MIKKVEMYETDGKLFSSERAAIEHRQNRIGEYLDKHYQGPVLSPGQRIAIAELLHHNRHDIAKLVNY